MSEYKLVPVEPGLKIATAMATELPDYQDTAGALVLAKAMYAAALAAATSPEWENIVVGSFTPSYVAGPPVDWVKVSDRLPKREDADEDGRVWAFASDGDPAPFLWSYRDITDPPIDYWMPKPRQQPPEPPEVE